MPPLPPPEWFLRLGGALDLADAEQARSQARKMLAEIREEQDGVRERLEMMSSASFEGIMVHVGGAIIDVNNRLCEMMGYTREEMMGREPLRRSVAPEDLPAVIERIASHYEGAYVITAIRKDGTRFRAEIQAKQGHIGDRPVRVAAFRDVTERERTHALLRESEQRFRDLARTAFDFSVFTRDGIIVGVDGDPQPILGVTPEQMMGQPVAIGPATRASAHAGR